MDCLLHTSSSISVEKLVHRRNMAAYFDDEVRLWLMKWSCRRRAACAVRCVLRAWDNLWLIWLSWMAKRLSLCRRLCQFFFRSSRFPLRFKAFAVFFYTQIMEPRVCRRLCWYLFWSSRFVFCSKASVIWCNSGYRKGYGYAEGYVVFFQDPQGFRFGSKIALLSVYIDMGTQKAMSVFFKILKVSGSKIALPSNYIDMGTPKAMSFFFKILKVSASVQIFCYELLFSYHIAKVAPKAMLKFFRSYLRFIVSVMCFYFLFIELRIHRRLCRFFPGSSRFPLWIKSFAMSFY